LAYSFSAPTATIWPFPADAAAEPQPATATAAAINSPLKRPIWRQRGALIIATSLRCGLPEPI
jgi:hypothetical protein